MSFGYCIATLLEFAGVHYFTKVRITRTIHIHTHQFFSFTSNENLIHKHSDTAEIIYEAIENKITVIKIDGTGQECSPILL